MNQLTITGSQRSVRMEISIDSITESARSIYTSTAERTKRGLPVKFHRVFASNVPDYTGMLSLFTELLPIMERSTKECKTLIQHNCLMNNGIWKDMDHYMFSSTLVPNIRLLSDFIGVEYCTEGNSIWSDCQWTWSGRDAKPKPTLVQLSDWLHQVFLTSILPPRRNSMRPV